MTPDSRSISLSIGLASMAVIAFQLVVMQMLSISQWHHFAYMVISMAMLGFGAAGTFLALFREPLRRHFSVVLPILYLLSGISMALSVRLVGIFGDFDTFLLFFDRSQIGLMAFSYLIYCLPFFFAGLAITLIFYHQIGSIGSHYFFNLAGSALGALVVIFLFWWMPLPLIPAFLALLPLGAAWMVRIRRTRFTAAVLASLLVPLFGAFYHVTPQISEYKAISASLQLPDAEVIYERSGPYGLLQAVSAPAQRFAPALSLQYRGEPPVRDILFNNGEYFGTLLGRYGEAGHGGAAQDEAGKGETGHGGAAQDEAGKGEAGHGEAAHDEAGHERDGSDDNADTMDHILDYTTRGLPYALRDPASVLVLNAGTGTDVSQARYHGADGITAVEPHRQANRLLTEVHPGWIDSLYNLPGVSLHGQSVRSWLAGNRDIEKDLVILPVIGAFGGTSGVRALEEQYHMTLEAFRELFDRLSDDGMIAVTVWGEYPPKSSLKLLATWRILLEETAPPALETAPPALETAPPARDTRAVRVDHIQDHILAVRSWGTITFVLSRRPFSEQERASTRAFSRSRSFDPLILPGIEPEERDHFNMVEDRSFFDYVDTLLYGDYEAFFDDYVFDVHPATDNRPFFSHYMNLRSIPGVRDQFGDRELPYMELGFIMAGVTLLQIVLASVILIILPLFRVGWKGTRRRWTFLYFTGIGIGFMFFEIVLIQKLVLYLGQPVYATAAVLAALLLASGTGSYYSSSWSSGRPTVLRTSGVIMGLIVIYALFLMPLLDVSMSWPLLARIVKVAVLLALPAFFMGMMFPFGLRRLSGSNETQIPWACGVDSCMSVSATALATLVALEAGFAVVMVISAMGYGLTAIAATRIGED